MCKQLDLHPQQPAWQYPTSTARQLSCRCCATIAGFALLLVESAGVVTIWVACVCCSERFSSGCLTLDRALGGGYPKGRIVEIYGPEASGKTTLALHAIAEVQKAGGTCLFVDAEHAFDASYAEVGVTCVQKDWSGWCQPVCRCWPFLLCFTSIAVHCCSPPVVCSLCCHARVGPHPCYGNGQCLQMFCWDKRHFGCCLY